MDNLIKNPKEYDTKEPTNLRLEEEIKVLLKEKAEKEGVTMSDIINDVLAKMFEKK